MDILSDMSAKITPSNKEIDTLNKVLAEFSDKVNKTLKKMNITANLVVGGSVGKGSWLPGIHDVDFFLRFGLKKHSKITNELSDITESILKKDFKN